MEELLTTIGKHVYYLSKIFFKDEFLLQIGVGTFSRIILTRRSTEECDEYHALKVMAIRDIVQMKQVQHINDERMILATVQHPFIVSL